MYFYQKNKRWPKFMNKKMSKILFFTEILMNATETKCSHKILFNSFNCEIKMKV